MFITKYSQACMSTYISRRQWERDGEFISTFLLFFFIKNISSLLIKFRRSFPFSITAMYLLIYNLGNVRTKLNSTLDQKSTVCQSQRGRDLANNDLKGFQRRKG